MRVLYALLADAVDYAGLSPPAKLSMRSAVENYAAYVAGEDSWMLGRFVLPVSRLNEFEDAADHMLPAPGNVPWHLSVLGGSDSEHDWPMVAAFNERHASPTASGRAVIDTLELRVAGPSEILSNWTEAGTLTRFYEFPIDRELPPFLDAIASVGGRAKLRTGGLTEEAFPPGIAIVRFISACIRAGIPYKATAGLHHPLRGRFRLTYAPNSPSGMMFGFLNLFLTGAFLAKGMEEATALRVLEEQEADAFVLHEDGISWKGHHLSVEDLRRSRRMNTASFGSCSFVEPSDELKHLGLLPCPAGNRTIDE